MPDLAREVGAARVFVAEDFGPYGRARDDRVAHALPDADGAVLTRVGSPYAVPPGEVRNQEGNPYKVFTPFARAWLEQLAPDQRAAVRAHVIDERAYGEIAGELNTSEAVVRKRVSRGLAAMRVRMGVRR